jgi:hypothetical protein
LSKFRRRSARGTKWTLAYSLQSPPNWEYCHPRTDSSKARNPRPELPTASSFDAPKQHPLNAQDEPSSVGSCSKLTEVIQTDASFGISFEMEVASTSAGKAEPNLTEVIFTSAPKPRAVRRLVCPHPCLEIHVPNCVRWQRPGLAKASLNSHRPDTSTRFPVHIETRVGPVRRRKLRGTDRTTRLVS